jgi:hypothetical protein
VVLARGMDDGHFALNPIVTLQHAYALPPAGRSLWRRRLKEGELRGIKAKTHYPPRPDAWPADDWVPDYAYELVRVGLLRGKSIGLLPLKVRTPTAEEARDRPGWDRVHLVIEEWLLLEYACCFLPTQQNAVVEAVSKSLERPLPAALARALGLPEESDRAVAFTPLEEIDRHVRRRLADIDWRSLVHAAVKMGWEKARGRV